MGFRVNIVLLVVVVGSLSLGGFKLWSSATQRTLLEGEVGSSLEMSLQAAEVTVKTYFTEHERRIRTMAASKSTIDAMRRFKKAARRPVEALSPDQEAKLRSYYNDDFGMKYRSEIGESADTNGLIDGLDDIAKHYQAIYISDNPNPLGAKDLLVRGEAASGYNDLHEAFHPEHRRFLNEYGYYDIFLVEPTDGRVVYSVFKELDYMTKLQSGNYAKSGLADTYRSALELNEGEVTLIDFRPYLPSYDAPAAFMGTPIVADGQVLGVLVFQLSIETLSGVLADLSGNTETQEIILLGRDGRFRTNSRLEESHSVVASFREEGIRYAEALELPTNREVTEKVDYRGVSTLGSAEMVTLLGVEYRLVAKRDTAEVYGELEAQEAETWVAFFFVLAVMGAVAFIGANIALRPLARTIDAMQGLTSGERGEGLLSQDERTRNDEFGGIYRAVDTLRQTLASNEERAEASRLSIERLLLESEQVKAAIDSSDTGFVVFDVECGVKYANSSWLRRFRRSAEDTVNKPCSEVLPQAYELASSLLNITEPVVERLVVNGSPLDVKFSPIISTSGARLGMCTEWTDVSQAVRAQDALASVVESAGEGNLSVSLEVGGWSGFYKLVGEGLNSFIRTVKAPIGELQEASKRLGAGDLTVTLGSEFRGDFAVIQVAFDAAVRRLSGVMHEVTSATQQVAVAASQLRGSAENLAEGARTQQLIVNESSQAIEETSSMARANHENAEEARSLVKEAVGLATSGEGRLADMMSSITDVSKRSKDITKIIKVIDEIAFQTNMLALNAAVEAARAGKHGKGFAVVAQEIGNLAQRSAEAAKETERLIEESRLSIQSAVKMSDGAGGAFRDIAGQVGEIDTLIEGVVAASQEQEKGVQLLASRVREVRNLGLAAATQSNEVASASEELLRQTEVLQGQLDTFELGGARALMPVHQRTGKED